MRWARKGDGGDGRPNEYDDADGERCFVDRKVPDFMAMGEELYEF